MLEPISGYAGGPLLSLEEACEPLLLIVCRLSLYVSRALENSKSHGNSLTRDESAAIRLYTMEWDRVDNMADDIAVINGNEKNVGVLLGYGNGSFAAQTTFPTGMNPWVIAVGDFNNDTRLDIVIANGPNTTISVLLGYGNGTFATQTTFSTSNNPQAVTVGDLNKDNRLDIVAANFDSATVGVFLGYGNGTFANQSTFSTGNSPQSVTVGDFNNDTRLDIAVANDGANSVGILLNICYCCAP
ncbi:unnamed protein product [Rotaria socialis]|uniref:VCBS repeat-containing protein n=1 Tax=Rotaria socialis TaxID=392032 RepID=A0A818L4S6_9BILA|nr:unnamed protein product [Rotaria socialis]